MKPQTNENGNTSLIAEFILIIYLGQSCKIYIVNS